MLGHSYSSTTVADAFALGGMHANDAVLLGCPGNRPGPQRRELTWTKVYVSAATDPISMLGQLDGLSPYVNRGNLTRVSCRWPAWAPTPPATSVR